MENSKKKILLKMGYQKIIHVIIKLLIFLLVKTISKIFIKANFGLFDSVAHWICMIK